MSTAHIKAQSNFFKEHVEYNRIFKILGPLRSWLIQVCVSQKICFKQFFVDKIIVLTHFRLVFVQHRGEQVSEHFFTEKGGILPHPLTGGGFRDWGF